MAACNTDTSWGGRLDAENQQLTHVMLRQGRSAELLLPVVELLAGQRGIVWLRRSLEEVPDMKLVTEAAPAGASSPAGISRPSGPAAPEGVATATTLRPEAPVHARDGVVGRLLRLGIRPHTGQITHLIACIRHFFREKEVKFDWNLVERIDGNALYLKMDKDEVHGMDR